jgi:hypothetical protein
MIHATLTILPLLGRMTLERAVMNLIARIFDHAHLLLAEVGQLRDVLVLFYALRL